MQLHWQMDLDTDQSILHLPLHQLAFGQCEKQNFANLRLLDLPSKQKDCFFTNSSETFLQLISFPTQCLFFASMH